MNEKIRNKKTKKTSKKEKKKVKYNISNCLIYGEKSDCMNEDIFFRQNEKSNLNELNKIAKIDSQKDTQLSDKNLLEFLNKDLINALDIDVNNIGKDSKKQSVCYANVISELTSTSSSPDIGRELQESNFNINIEDYDEQNTKNVYKYLPINLGILNENGINNGININNKGNNNIIKDNNVNSNDLNNSPIELLNDPLFAPMFIPKKVHANNFNNNKEIHKSGEIKLNNNFERVFNDTNVLNNKFDESNEKLMFLSLCNKEEKTKLPLEIRVGDWICLHCNNLNFSFRIKCNRCGILRKASPNNFEKSCPGNKYHCFGNYNNGYYPMNLNRNTNF
jgi:hypothetical protein